MSDTTNKTTSRRDFLKDTSRIAAASAVMAAVAPRMYAGQSNTIKVALIGCGGRGTGAADNALSVKQGPIQLVAMGDVFEHRLKSSYENLDKRHPDKMKVPRSRRFVGFDASPPLVEALRKGDIDALVVQNPRKMGRLTVETLADHLQGRDVEGAVDTGAVLVTRENLGNPEVARLLE